MSELALEDAQLARNLRIIFAGFGRRRSAVLIASRDGTWESVPKLPDETGDLQRVITSLETRADEQEAAIRGPERSRLEAELAELEARDWLQGALDDVRQEISRKEKLAQLVACIRDTSTGGITAKCKSLADEFVTNKLRDRFVDELNALNARRMRLELARAPGTYGAANHRIQLIAAPNEDVSSVLSEGEHGCAALAGFLAELSTANHESGLIFDDPVSSLDHKWRDAVATRLVKEAAVRQVIVFTHDIVFLHDLLDRAEDNAVESQIQRIHRSSSGPGTVSDHLPWKTQNALDRLDKIKKDARSARSYHEKGDGDEYESAIWDVYNKLRATVERAIEENLFSRVVVRHRDYINLKPLPKLKAADHEDVDYLLQVHSTCCGITDAHDPSTGRNATPPSPEEVLQEVEEFEEWVRGLKQRQQNH